MSYSYSGNPSDTPLDECRFLLGDTDESNPILQDEEILYIIANANSNTNLLRYTLFMQAATVFARDIKRSLGPQSEDPTSRLNFFKAQAEAYRLKIASGGVSVPVLAHPKVFRKGMHSNPPWPKPGGSRYVR